MITFNRRRDRQQGRPPQFLRGPLFFSKSDCARRDVPRLLEAVPEIRERRLVEELGAESEISREGIVMSGRAPADQGLFFGVALVASAVMSSAFFCGE
jgi:hypothetical protein